MPSDIADQPAPPAAPTGHAPSEGDDLRCPLCDYDLRGLIEPCCPECGFRFDWADITDPAKRLHPYLFEHHPRHNAWSFVRTMAGGLRPNRFWSLLKPSQPSRPGRLVLYWLIASLLLPLGYAGTFAWTALKDVDDMRRVRASLRLPEPANFGEWWDREFGRDDANRGWGREYPPPTSFRYIGFIYREHYRYQGFNEHIQGALLYLAWPWLTLAALLIFQASMRRVKVRTVHVLRCALYCCDAGLWLGVAAALAAPEVARALDLGRYMGYRDVALAALPFAAVTAWRLSAACRHYLRFDHPVATAVATQLIVFLFVLVCLYVGPAWGIE